MAERKRKPKPNPEMEQLAQSLIAAMASQQDGYNASDVYETMQEGLKLAMERLMQTELTAFLGYQKSSQEEKPTSNRRNGTTSKTVHSKHGALELNIPRDRNSAFESHILPKHQRDISEIEDKVISMYARGMSDRDISDTIEEIYGFSLSATVIGQMTDAVLPLVKEWQNRPLRKVYPFIFIDALYVDIKVERCSQKRAIYVMIGIDEDGRKDVLGFWNKATEGADEWMKIFDEIQFYQSGDIRIVKDPKDIDKIWIFRCSAEKGEPGYSEKRYAVQHYEGGKKIEGMNAWASWYCFNKKDDGMFEAELDEAWWWGGGHNDGGTIRREVPEEWLSLPYDEFLEKVVTLASASYYGFTAEILRNVEGLKAFFGFED